MEHLWWHLGSVAGGALFEVTLRGASARVCLMDIEEYESYTNGDEYEYHGGFFDVSPVVLETPYDHNWYLVVDSYASKIRVWVEQVFD